MKGKSKVSSYIVNLDLVAECLSHAQYGMSVSYFLNMIHIEYATFIMRF